MSVNIYGFITFATKIEATLVDFLNLYVDRYKDKQNLALDEYEQAETEEELVTSMDRDYVFHDDFSPSYPYKKYSSHFKAKVDGSFIKTLKTPLFDSEIIGLPDTFIHNKVLIEYTYVEEDPINRTLKWIKVATVHEFGQDTYTLKMGEPKVKNFPYIPNSFEVLLSVYDNDYDTILFFTDQEEKSYWLYFYGLGAKNEQVMKFEEPIDFHKDLMERLKRVESIPLIQDVEEALNFYEEELIHVDLSGEIKNTFEPFSEEDILLLDNEVL